MSVKLDIFNDIVTAVEAIVDNGVKVINTVELWNSQLDNLKVENAFNFPAVFIEFALIPWTSTDQPTPSLGPEGNISKVQKGENALITLHVAFFQLEDETVSFTIISPIIDEVYSAIQGLDGEFYSEFRRTEERQDTDHDMVIDWQMDFTFQINQCGVENKKLVKIIGGTIDVETTVTLDIDNDVIRTGDGKP